MYGNESMAIKTYADWLGISEEKARRTRDGFFPKEALNPDEVIGLGSAVEDAVALKYTPSALTKEQLSQLIQIPPRR